MTHTDELHTSVDVGEILWDGRPEIGPRPSDLSAALVAFGIVFGAVGGVLALRPEPIPWAEVGALYGAVAAGATIVCRAVGGGMRLTFLAVFWGILTAASGYTGQSGLALLCPATAVGVIGVIIFLHYRQRRGIRYQVSKSHGLMGEGGRYTIAFSLAGDPRVRRDLFGTRLGSVEFGELEATITTRDGREFQVPSQTRSFRRVRDPHRLLEALAAAGADEAGAPATS